MLQPWIGRAASRVKLSASVEEARIYQARLNWRDIERIKKNFDIQIVLKGIGTAEDAKIALECVKPPKATGQTGWGTRIRTWTGGAGTET